ncbi:PilW family protein [Vreelandella olivaria]|uniref:PilW family protein n=1 Tax=Vreelandella olivaria TaxID=390919 RepID=UPI00201EE38C|nr:prepilin-type N-terminal cleavage/methylation domain-containing protein [Halomonas olivaria]
MDVQRGFTLTELLVALVISVTVILGAGQLFLSALITFRQVDALGRQQEALVYTSAMLADALRRRHAVNDSGESLFHLRCIRLETACRCTVQDMQAAQPLVSFDKPGSAVCERDEPLGRVDGSGGISVVSLPLGPQGREVSFYVTHRGSVLGH